MSRQTKSTAKYEKDNIIEGRIIRRSARLLPESQQKKLLNEELKNKEVDISSLPPIHFTGKIYYVTDFEGCANICDQVIERINKFAKDIVPIGFDLEWPFSFQTGSGKTALAQTCKVVENNCIDCGPFCNKIYNRSGRWSLQRLTAYLLEKQISKDAKVRNSKWHILPLSDAQKSYAATDAYVSLLLHLTIQKAEEIERLKITDQPDVQGDAVIKEDVAEQKLKENLPADLSESFEEQNCLIDHDNLDQERKDLKDS
ncbi:hypothetical protein G9C98_002101 [Cotesia typhae]|uniref:3'-5' exonuclease domain-containing protein n=1 Tax=Cotesia typhae TaxID=2053667 RepID=A0A8J5QU27_9HYME|nr:hypothetical protein G9C98_002101 [Cotesia typhae]